MRSGKKSKTNVSREDVIRAFKTDEHFAEKKNVTFRLPVNLYEAFSKTCEEDGYSVTFAIQKLMAGYVGWWDPKND
jgi:hypothetical protein